MNFHTKHRDLQIFSLPPRSTLCSLGTAYGRLLTLGVKRKELEAVYSPSSVLESGKDATLVVGVKVVRWLCTSLNIGHLPSITTNSKLVPQREYEDGYTYIYIYVATGRE